MADNNLKILPGFCQCGCGQKTKAAQRTDYKKGWVRGEPNKFVLGHNSLRGKSKEYLRSFFPEHDKANKWGYAREHLIRAERTLGKPLPKKAVIHHVNGTKMGGPLVICQDLAYHNLIHQRIRAFKISGHPDWRKCVICKEYDSPGNLLIYIGKCNRAYHPICKRTYEKIAKDRRKSSGF